MRSSFLLKSQPKITEISALRNLLTLRNSTINIAIVLIESYASLTSEASDEILTIIYFLNSQNNARSDFAKEVFKTRLQFDLSLAQAVIIILVEF